MVPKLQKLFDSFTDLCRDTILTYLRYSSIWSNITKAFGEWKWASSLCLLILLEGLVAKIMPTKAVALSVFSQLHTITLFSKEIYTKPWIIMVHRPSSWKWQSRKEMVNQISALPKSHQLHPPPITSALTITQLHHLCKVNIYIHLKYKIIYINIYDHIYRIVTVQHLQFLILSIP